MNATKTLCGLILCAATLGAAHAQVQYEHSYSVRIRNTPAGKTATLTRADGAFVYANVALSRQNCPSSASAVPVRTTSALIPLSGRRLKLQLPTVGSSTCQLVGTLDLNSDDDPPIMTDPGPPGQITANVPPLPELDVNGLFGIWPVAAAWGTTIVVPAASADSRSGGKCTFPYAYMIRNSGVKPSAQTSVTLQWNDADAPIFGVDDIPELAPNTSTIVNGHFSVPAGLSTLLLEVDAPDQVEEMIEANLRTIDVVVTGSCT